MWKKNSVVCEGTRTTELHELTVKSKSLKTKALSGIRILMAPTRWLQRQSLVSDVETWHFIATGKFPVNSSSYIPPLTTLNGLLEQLQKSDEIKTSAMLKRFGGILLFDLPVLGLWAHQAPLLPHDTSSLDKNVFISSFSSSRFVLMLLHYSLKTQYNNERTRRITSLI